MSHSALTQPPPQPTGDGILELPPLPRPGERRLWTRLRGNAPALAIAEAARRHQGPVLVISASDSELHRLQRDLAFFAGEDLPLLEFPDWETLPYDLFSPHEDIVSTRLATLARLPALPRGILAVAVDSLLPRLCPRDYIAAHALALQEGDTLDLEAFRRRLEAAGYRCVAQVTEHGEFAVRGSILDLFPMGSTAPYRIDLFDQEIDSIRRFDPDTQRSTGEVPAVELLPAREYALGEEAVARFRQNFRRRFEGDPNRSPVYRDVSQGLGAPGLEYYLPLFHERLETLFDYLPDSTLVVELPGLAEAAARFWEDASARYEERRHDVERPLVPPAELFLAPGELEQALEKRPRLRLERMDAPPDRPVDLEFPAEAPPPLLAQPRHERPYGALQDFLERAPGRVLVAAESAGRREFLRELLADLGHRPEPVADWKAFREGRMRLGLTVAPLDQGLVLGEPPLAIVAESQIFGERAVQERRRRRRNRDVEAIVHNLYDLEIGAPVVHEEQGVGRYQGLTRLEVGGVETEFLTLEYAGGDRLYVPVSSLHLVSRYTGASPEKAPLHKLGGEQWKRIRRKAAEQARDVAAELLDVYARREAARGRVHEIREEEYAAFAAAFPFEETPDQQAAIDAVLEDMRSPRPMDRVVCGDVGFGKTEVAMRAAFVAVQSGQQVAVLVPTTLLAQQHYQNFLDRFADWPVRIEAFSRFRSKGEQARVLQDLAAGRVDIVIGTHKLLQDEVRFRDLGLVILDEEHRFGVRHKERLKALRAEVDVLTLTATPIPRTLNMALSGLRDLSIIATPPAERVAIKTFVLEWSDHVLREALQRELRRGGQVYFLHNDVSTMERTRDRISSLLPGVEARIAHGQMRERDLEQVMLDFYHQRFNVLVCTTIIESGIDVPSANTIIIDRADKLGLAQLHQLRGRVGRSHHRAYAYLVVPPRKAMTPDAIKRLEAIEALEDLGAGFVLSTHDLEIRGAGELLGEHQSGQIQEIGFTLYQELLERAVRDLRAGRQPELDRPLDHGPEIDLQVPALLPEDYIPDIHTRLTLYKRIASAGSEGGLHELQVEMIDRFGLLPEPARQLFEVTRLKLHARPLGIAKVDAGPRGLRIRFGPEPRIDTGALIRLIQGAPEQYRFDGKETLRMNRDLPDAATRVEAVERLLETLAHAPETV